jgi:hypothetical protein
MFDLPADISTLFDEFLAKKQYPGYISQFLQEIVAILGMVQHQLSQSN